MIKYKNIEEKILTIKKQKYYIIILFTCTENLKHLCESENIFGDRKFSYASNHFYQLLYIIHIFKHYY